MQSNNPILTRVETYSDLAEPMTIQGAIQKSVLLTVIAAGLGIALFFYCAMTANLSIAYAAAIVSAIGSFVLALITTFKPNNTNVVIKVASNACNGTPGNFNWKIKEMPPKNAPSNKA